MTDGLEQDAMPRRVTLQLAVLCLVSVTLVNGLLWLLSPAGYDETALHHTIDMLRAHSGDDSWGPMALALEYLEEPSSEPLYAALFFEGGIKFQYPPSALFTLLAMFLAGRENVRVSDDMTPLMWPAVNDLVGWVFIFVMFASCAALLELRLRQTYPAQDWKRHRMPRILIVGLLTLAFYPFVKGFTLGQVQLWINAAFAAALLLFALEWRAASGLIIGLLSLLKPHYGLIAVWGLRNRDWRFAMALVVTAALGLAISVLTFGWANHLDYLSVVSFMSERGESYYPNQSVNGLLNRFIGRSYPELYHNADYGNGGFPPYNGWVYWPTLLASGAILLASLLRRSGESHRLISLCLMAVSVTIAAPIAWEHHYGLLLPIYAAAFVALAGNPARLLWLAASYLLVATFIAAARLLAPSVLNMFQSYMLFGSLILLALLHGLLPIREGAGLRNPNRSEVTPVKLFFVLVACGVALAAPAFADEKTDAAIRALDALEADPAKLEPFCAILKEMAALGEGDDVKSEELEVKMEEYLTSLGPEYGDAWSIGEDLNPSSPEAANLDAAFDRIEQKCGN